MGCLFCKIVRKEIPAKVEYEDTDFLVFHDLHPEAPLHLLCITKIHREWQNEFDKEGIMALGSLLATAKRVAKEKNVFDACKLIFNVGKTGHVPHIHLHLLGGWGNDIPMHNV